MLLKVFFLLFPPLLTVISRNYCSSRLLTSLGEVRCIFSRWKIVGGSAASKWKWVRKESSPGEWSRWVNSYAFFFCIRQYHLQWLTQRIFFLYTLCESTFNKLHNVHHLLPHIKYLTPRFVLLSLPYFIFRLSFLGELTSSFWDNTWMRS